MSPPARPQLAHQSPYSQLNINHEEFNTQAFVHPSDGRVHIAVNKLKDGPLSALLSALHSRSRSRSRFTSPTPEHENQKASSSSASPPTPPKLNIVVMIIGSRGDVQPFVAISKILKDKYGHRVRLATHPAFRDFITGEGVEFFSVGGDPAELMAFMVKNPGLIPSIETIKAGDVLRRREQMFEMFLGFWRACVEPKDGYYPFVADAIIANPPSFAHVHCAEKLGIPLHLMFTFPYSPTQTMPHPLAMIQSSNLGKDYTNAISYPMIDMMTWQGLGDLVNKFRQNTLGLEPVATLWAPGMISRLKVPFTYMWSPALIPKPYDWGDHIDVTGFVFLDLASSYEPPQELADFLDAGPPPVYIGFGSIVVDDPDALTQTIFTAIKSTGVRTLVSKGWGGIGSEDTEIPENVCMLDNAPHDWLFSKVSAVVHHGGAGTTAIGLYHGRPTMIVPFFGDQAFWGSMVANAGAGADPVPHKELTAEKLADGIKKLLSEECQLAAGKISKQIREDDGDGAENAVMSFFKGIEALKKGKRGLSDSGKEWGEGGPRGPGEGKWGSGGPGIRCSFLEEKVAVWRIRRTKVRLSALAAWLLVQDGKLTWKDLRLIRHTEWNDFDGPGEPFTGGITALAGSIAGVAKGIVTVPYTWYKGARRLDSEGLDLAREIRNRSKSRSRSHSRPTNHPSTSESKPHSSSPSPSPSSRSQREKDPIPQEIAKNTSKALSKAARAGARAPMEVSLAVAQGFHNAPRLFGDEVRHPYRITGLQSGLRAAGKEFALGVYDGVTGIVTKPYHGAKEGGAAGFVKGLGRGVAGGVLKTNAATAGVVGFTLKGVHMEVRKGKDRGVGEVVHRERIRQGEAEARELQSMGEDVVKEVKRRVEEGWGLVEEEKKVREVGDGRWRRRRERKKGERGEKKKLGE
ncbi:UDP-Glycosyltransferase/glycogen phosphorylase [Choiromyces venosus 120613-1]|uniref:UDP-Glycosyltransferase/glycogen phosphorylase n=1 Tax=Choiromyces venosus 120613-1 TaxID=1336337 RepID=A0A3N4JH08_9PEZI|nr:UDP-Glycosyltransferase/glycogen phosphorylase [Choiromyces venosus 120613-1]